MIQHRPHTLSFNETTLMIISEKESHVQKGHERTGETAGEDTSR